MGKERVETANIYIPETGVIFVPLISGNPETIGPELLVIKKQCSNEWEFTGRLLTNRNFKFGGFMLAGDGIEHPDWIYEVRRITTEYDPSKGKPYIDEFDVTSVTSEIVIKVWKVEKEKTLEEILKEKEK